jgi:hypothetical protein
MDEAQGEKKSNKEDDPHQGRRFNEIHLLEPEECHRSGDPHGKLPWCKLWRIKKSFLPRPKKRGHLSRLGK